MLRAVYIAVILAAMPPALLRAGELGLSVNGLSYHYSTKTFMDAGKERELNGLNTGLGVHYLVKETAASLWSLEAGFYRDSLFNTARYAAAGYRYRLTPSLSAGISLIYFDTPSYRIRFGPLPVVTYRLRELPFIRDLSFSLLWLPDLGSEKDRSAVGLYCTWHLLTTGD